MWIGSGHDTEYAYALKVWIGSSVFEGNPLNKCHILYGDGMTGKTTFLKTIQAALGDYGASVDPTIFVDRQNQHPASLLPLVDNHFVVAPELAPGSLKSSLLKTVTGDDMITVRSMRQNPRTEAVRASLWFSCNELPTLRLVDSSIRRRLLVWPFDNKPERENPELSTMLQTPEHQSGVVRWIIDGMAEYVRIRANMATMPIPEQVRSETDKYFDIADTVGLWVSEDAMPANGKHGEHLPTSTQLFNAYFEWCKDQDQKPLGKRAFSLWMARHYTGVHRANGTCYPILLRAAAVKGRGR